MRTVTTILVAVVGLGIVGCKEQGDKDKDKVQFPDPATRARETYVVHAPASGRIAGPKVTILIDLLDENKDGSPDPLVARVDGRRVEAKSASGWVDAVAIETTAAWDRAGKGPARVRIGDGTVEPNLTGIAELKVILESTGYEVVVTPKEDK